VCGRRPEPLAAVRREIEAAGGECLDVPANVRDAEQVERLLETALERLGRIDVLVNNAGGQFPAPAQEISDGGWRAVHDLSVAAPWRLSREVATRSMIPGGGGLIVFLGFSPVRGIPQFAHACAARAAVANLAQGLALEWSRFAIRSVCVQAGSILTEGLRGYGEESVEGWRRGVPLGRLGDPREVGALIAFLASAGGSYITGTTIVIDGGLDAWGQGEPPPAIQASQGGAGAPVMRR
jgi:citronellol/citronellal dehydrogenase